MSEKDLAEIKRTFEKLDVNNDKRISVNEIVKGAQMLGCNPTSKEAAEMVEEWDKNGNGYIEYEEYEEVMKKELKKLDQEEALFLDAFKKFDKNGDGTVDFAELKKALTRTGDKMTDEDVDFFFKEADLDKDGKISYKEFVIWFNTT